MARCKPSGEAAVGCRISSLLNKEFRPKSDAAKTAVESAVKTLAEQAPPMPPSSRMTR